MSSRPVDILHLPLDQLAAVSMRRLRDSKVLEKAAKSTLYREKWRAADIRAEEIETYEDFARIPFITSRELRRAVNEGPIEKVLCSDVVHWFSTTGTTGKPKWIPYSQRDLELYMKIRDRCCSLLPSREGLKGFGVSAPAPFDENALAAFEKIRVMQTHMQVEGMIVCLTEVENKDAFHFVLEMKPNFIAAFPGFAMRFAEVIEERAPEEARQEFSRHKSLRNLAAYLVTRVKKIRPRNLSKFRFGLFGGEPLDPYREVLNRAFGLEPYEMYNLTEFIYPAIECRMHDGMHLWMDICVPEIIPEPELERKSGDDTYTPRAVPLWKAERGLKGEYVLTTFGEALPLIRYRIGDLIEVVSAEPCRCGITHPRIKVPRRSDDTICLGAIRFPAAQLEEKLLARTAYGEAQRWQLEITREGYRPKPIIRVEPRGEIKDRESFLREISKRLREIEALKTGIENKIVIEPVIFLEERISEEGRPVTKEGRIIYEGEN